MLRLSHGNLTRCRQPFLKCFDGPGGKLDLLCSGQLQCSGCLQGRRPGVCRGRCLAGHAHGAPTCANPKATRPFPVDELDELAERMGIGGISPVRATSLVGKTTCLVISLADKSSIWNQGHQQ